MSISRVQDIPEIPVETIGKTVIIQNGTDRPNRFSFDDVLWWKTSQSETFEVVAAPVCRNALQGFNGTVFAYGQTGSGKTHTMLGPEDRYSAEDSGIAPRAANFFFHAIENSPDVESAELRVSFVEVYNGELRDLNVDSSAGRQNLRVRQKINGETYVEGLNKQVVTGLSEVLKLIVTANSHRTMAATSMNKTSSRSHSIMTFYVKLKKSAESGGHKLFSKVNFIDLAGSEKVKKTGATGSRLKEAQAINQGLSTLARCIESLVKQRKSVPFRDSILTWILKDSLTGNTKTTLLVACSPHCFNREETVTTCRFAQRCKLIKTKVVSNKELSPAQMRSLIKKLQRQNAKLRDGIFSDEMLANARSGGGIPKELEDDMWQYKLQADSRKKALAKMKGEMEEGERQREELEQKLAEAEAAGEAHLLCEETIKDLESEIASLKRQLKLAGDSKRQLAIINAMLGQKIDDLASKHEKQRRKAVDSEMLADLAKARGDDLRESKRGLMTELKDLKFSSKEAQKIYDGVFNEMQELSTALDGQNDELEEMAGQLNDAEENLENKNLEMQKLKDEIRILKKNNAEREKESSGGKRSSRVHSTRFTMKRGSSPGLDSMLQAQEEYFQGVAAAEQKDWDMKEEKAWEEYLDSRAVEMGHKDGDSLLKSRRLQAKKDHRAGKIDYVPEDDELLDDIRVDFERAYDPITGEFHEIKESDIIRADNEIDDPWNWSTEEVVAWLGEIGMEKYGKAFSKEAVDGKMVLVDLTAKNLKRDLGVKDIHVDRMLREIRDLRLRSPAYEEWTSEQGFDEQRTVTTVTRTVEVLPDAYTNEIDGDFDLDDLQYELTEEEKRFGEQFWALDELFKILDVFEEGKLDLSAFKQGLHALRVNLTDEEMESVFDQIDLDQSNTIEYSEFIRYLQFTDLLPPQSRKYATDILSAMPRVASNRRQYVMRAAMVIKYGVKYNNSKVEISNYLKNKGLTRAEIDTAWKQFRFNPRGIPNIEFGAMALKKGKLVSMAAVDTNVDPFDDYQLFKLLKRAGHRSYGSKEFNDLDYLRAAGFDGRLQSMRCWFDLKSEFFNGYQMIYECSNGEQLTAPKHFVKHGTYVEESFEFLQDEAILSVTVYLAHFISGLYIETDKRSKLFGSDHSRESVTLSAPAGSQIMAFYGSLTRLIESLGCYVVKNDNLAGKAKTFRSGTSRRKTKDRKGGMQAVMMPSSSSIGGEDVSFSFFFLRMPISSPKYREEGRIACKDERKAGGRSLRIAWEERVEMCKVFYF